MRLLHYGSDGELCFTSNLKAADLPPYAILSHTWTGDEVNYEEIINRSGKNKAGYIKIDFCARQAKQDRLQYFWVDTCCINKQNEVELCEAISSMFRWYSNAAKCYVYLSDVAYGKRKADADLHPWAAAFQACRWFSRGWTLQELLAPKCVEFFTKERTRLGDKASLHEYIQAATRIPNAALQGEPLMQFSINERLKWVEHRKTTVPVDRVYCLIGIFGVQLTPLLGESQESAYKRLIEEAEVTNACLRDLRLSDPHHDKKRIEDTKGGLLEDSFRWVLQNEHFNKWRDVNRPQRLLWINGDPGKGKTMLLCGIINELNKGVDNLSFFFCQETIPNNNSATNVLRGLIYLLVRQQPYLSSHFLEKYKQAGSSLFRDSNAWVALSKIFEDIVLDKSLKHSFLVLDALDECTTDLPKLLDLITRAAESSPKVKWLLSSRKESNIRQKLDSIGDEAKLSLELKQNAEHVSQAVDVYIDYKLSRLNSLGNDDLRRQVRNGLREKANGTFLWVALVIQELEGPESILDPLATVEEAPLGLHQLYDRMLDRIQQRIRKQNAEICQLILASAAVAYRPLSLVEMFSLRGLVTRSTISETMKQYVDMCGSFLTLREDQIYLVHQSAKDYLSAKMQDGKLPPQGKIHHGLFTQSVKLLSSVLKRDMYNLVEADFRSDQVVKQEPDPLAAALYSCVYWVDHLHDSKLESAANSGEDLCDEGVVHVFMKTKFLYWLEALSLVGCISVGVVSMAKLQSLMKNDMSARNESLLTILVNDAQRFIMSHNVAIAIYPLQAYVSALLFSPLESVVRRLFQHEQPKSISIKPNIDRWSPCLLTLEGHSTLVTSVAFSHNSALLASASLDAMVKIWDAHSGRCELTLHHIGAVSVAFSHDSSLLASASGNSTVRVWDAHSGICKREIFHSGILSSVVFSHDSVLLVSASDDGTIKLWDTHSGKCELTLKHGKRVHSVVFSHDSTWLASASSDSHGQIWNTRNGHHLLTLRDDDMSWIKSIAFSHDSTQLATASHDSCIRVWDTSTGQCTLKLKGDSPRYHFISVAFSHDSSWIVSTSTDFKIRIWDLFQKECIQVFEGHTALSPSAIFSHDSTRVASSSFDCTVKIWEFNNPTSVPTLEGHNEAITSLLFFQDSELLASSSWDGTVKVTDVRNGNCLFLLRSHSDDVQTMTASYDSSMLASASMNGIIKVWDLRNGQCLHTIAGSSVERGSMTFSRDSSWLASGSDDGTIDVWNMITPGLSMRLHGHHYSISLLAFSYDSNSLASSCTEGTIRVWHIRSGTCLLVIHVTQCPSRLSFNPSGTCLYTDINSYDIIGPPDQPSSLSITEPHTVGSLSLALRTQPLTSQDQSQDITIDEYWIINKPKCQLWLPPEFRPYESVVSGNTVAIGGFEGKVWICDFEGGTS